jgi:ligand-binding sensor domain-containing protein
LGVVFSMDGRDWQPLGLEGRLVWALAQAQGVAASGRSQRQLFAAAHVPERFDNELFRSTDDGRTWVRLPAGVRGRVHALASTRRGTLLAGTEHGFYRSTDDGQTWAFVGVARAQLTSIAVAPDNSLVAHGGGAWRSTDHARTWQRLDVSTGRLMFLRDGRLLSSGQISSDRGATWQRTGLSREISASLELVDGTLLAGTHTGVFRSTDGAAKWIEHSTGLTRFDIVALAATGKNTILAATGGGVFRSNDAGRSWRPLSYRFTRPPPRITHLVSGPEGRIVAGAFQGLFEYAEDTGDWQAIAETSSVQALVADEEGRIWIGTETDGVLMGRRIQGAWSVSSAGLPGATITALAMDRAGHLIVSTARGTYWTPVARR